MSASLEPVNTWVRKTGGVVQVREMNDAHLANAVRMCKRRGFVHRREVMALNEYASAASTPDGALAAAESELAAAKWNPHVDAIYDEAARRGLVL